MSNTNNSRFPCRICPKKNHEKDKAVQCDLYELWIHIKCINLNDLDCKYLQNCDESWSKNIQYSFNSFSMDNNFLVCCSNTDSSDMQFKELKSFNVVIIIKTYTRFRFSNKSVKKWKPGK